MTAYNTKWGGHIKTIDATTEPGKRTQAGMEHVNFVFGRVPESDYVTCIDIAKEIAYVLLRTGEGAKQVVGCSCPYFKKEHKVCEHLFALKDIDMGKLKPSAGWLVTFLENEEHWHVVDGKLVPPLMDYSGIDFDKLHKEFLEEEKAKKEPGTDSGDAGKPVPEPAKRPIIPPDHEIDIGVDVSDNTTTETTSTKDDTPKLWSRTCPYCPHVETGVFLDPVKAAIAEHAAICPENPANKPDAEVPKPEPQKETTVKSPAQDKPKSPAVNNSRTPLIDNIKKYVGNDVLEIFGDTGSGKSKFALEIAREATNAGMKVFYLDSERNLTDDDVKMLGKGYKYTPVLKEIDNTIQKLPAVDIVIIDSIGFPILTAYARYNMKQKGDALLTMIAMFGDLKQWAYRNNGMVIVVNQPESTFNKAAGHVLRPFGDKSQFAAKEIWWLKMIKRADKTTDHHTEVLITSFRSRTLGFGDKLYTMNIKSDEIDFESMR